MTAVEKDRRRFANARASKIRSGIANYLETLGVIAQAYAEADHLALGYESWQAYIDGEFSASRLRLSPEHRRKAVEELRLAGLSTRAIGTAIGVSHGTVINDLRASGGQDLPPDATVQGADGKTYAAKSPLVEAMTEAIEDAQERNETAADEPAETESPVDRSSRADQPVVADPGPATPAAAGDDPPPAAAWDPAERKAHEAQVQVRKDIESARSFARTFVTEVRNQCFTILAGYRLGERHLVTAEQIADCRRALDQLEQEVLADAQR